MVVCHCYVVSDREIRAQIQAGALTAEDLASRCAAGTRCGGCQPVIDSLLAETNVAIRRVPVAA